MARIKSALELALERTETVKGDRKGLESFQLKQEGKKLAGQFLEAGGEKSLKAAFSAHEEEELRAIRRGALDILMAQIGLPRVKEDLARVSLVGRGLSEVLDSKDFDRLYEQLVAAFDRFLQEEAQYEVAIRKQYQPKLKQKEEELARRTGRAVQLDPMQDPEFVAFYNKNMGALRERYQSAIDQVREQASLIFGED